MPTTVASINSTQPWTLAFSTPASVNTMTGEVSITPENLVASGGPGSFTTLTASGATTLASPVDVGDGSGSVTVDFNKAAGGTTLQRFYAGGVIRYTIGMTTTEDLEITRHDGAGAAQDKVIFDAAGGVTFQRTVTFEAPPESASSMVVDGPAEFALDISVQGAVVVYGGVAIGSGGLAVDAGNCIFAALGEYADDAAAELAGVQPNGLYVNSGTGVVHRLPPP